MRRSLLALTTATAVALSPIQALAQDSQPTATAEATDRTSSKIGLENSSYNKWLDEEVATTDNPATNTFLKLLVDFLLGAAAAIVIGGIYAKFANLF